jgi:hypothetical protein
VDGLGVRVAKLYETAHLLLRRSHWPVGNGLDFLCRNWNFSSKHIVALVLHLMKTEEALFDAQFQVFLFEAL